MSNKPGTFKKGDPRINRKGRPKTYDALRTLAQIIAHEVAKSSNDDPIVINGKIITVTEAIMRQWASSKNPILQRAFIEVAYGKTPETINVNGRNVNVSITADDLARAREEIAQFERELFSNVNGQK